MISNADGFLAEYGWLVDAFADRRRATATGRPIASATLTVDEHQAAQLTRLLGRRRMLRAGTVQVRTDQVNRSIAPLGIDLDGLLAMRHGTIVPRPDARASLARRRDDVVQNLLDGIPGSMAKAAQWARDDARTALANAVGTDNVDAQHALARIAIDALRLLPDRPTPLSVFAHTVTGSTHGLDHRTASERLISRMLSAEANEAMPESAEAWRRLWSRFGVVADGLHAHTAVWRLPVDGRCGPVAGPAAAATASGQPALVSYRALIADDAGSWAGAPTGHGWVFVVENNSLVELAALHDVRSPVLRSQPDSADLMVLDALVAAGWRLAVSADFEPGGLRGAEILLGRYSGRAAPWRLSAADYGSAPPHDEPPFDPTKVVAASWDQDLAGMMRASGRRVTEESRHGLLVADMVRGHP